MVARYGSGTPRSLQIFQASPSLMSLCHPRLHSGLNAIVQRDWPPARR